jgi:hypothetical protein
VNTCTPKMFSAEFDESCNFVNPSPKDILPKVLAKCLYKETDGKCQKDEASSAKECEAAPTGAKFSIHSDQKCSWE